jgi:signal transduction histidine kinase
VGLDLFILIAVCISDFLLGLLVYLRDIRSRAGQIFLAITVLTCFWLISSFFTDHLQTQALNEFFNKAAYINGFLALNCIMYFSYSFPVARNIPPLLKSFLWWFTPVVLVLSATSWVAGHVIVEGSEVTFFPGALLPLYALCLLGLLAVALLNLLQAAERYKGRVSRQARLILYSFGTAVLLSIVTNVILPFFSNSWMSTRIAPLLTLLALGGITYSIVRHGLFDFRLVVARSVGYIITLSVFASLYGFLVFGIAQVVFDVTFPIWLQVAISLTTAAASILFPIVKKFFDKLTATIFFRDDHDPQSLLDELNARMGPEIHAEGVSRVACRVVAKHLGLEHVSVYLDAGITISSSKNAVPHAAFMHLNGTLTRIGQPIVSIGEMLEDTDLQPAYEIMLDARITTIAELRNGREFLGWIYYGAKKNGEPFSGRDLRLLKIISDQVALAVQNTLRFREIATFNATLQDKIKEANKEYEVITQQMYAKNLKLAEINKTLTILRAIDVITLESQGTLKDLSQDVASAILNSSSYAFVAILALNKQQDKFISFQGWEVADQYRQASGFSLAGMDIKKLSMSLDEGWLASADHTILSIDKSTIEQAELDVRTKKLLSDIQLRLNLAGLMIVKLRARDMVVGAMLVGFTDDQHEEAGLELVGRFGESVGVSLDNKLLLEENVRALKHLQDANAKMKQLDETKDEFISLASHQLRTPLTAVKGYISMVLDGDAGELNQMQRKLLDQAFVSSQRMVFLIADLLNISRLRTGKFVIEPSPTNLADVVQGEVEQLRETAQGRGLKLEYHKPASFPALMLDETKVRQVVMNFLDNAIYYTPAGGDIQIHLRDKQQSVEFLVSDNGIGVPKHEQQHLFSKFYRAGNARKARPDGTGLGLFMAKKVVVAQHGAVIFKSKEGHGSTFGFTLAKDKLRPPTDSPK